VGYENLRWGGDPSCGDIVPHSAYLVVSLMCANIVPQFSKNSVDKSSRTCDNAIVGKTILDKGKTMKIQEHENSSIFSAVVCDLEEVDFLVNGLSTMLVEMVKSQEKHPFYYQTNKIKAMRNCLAAWVEQKLETIANCGTP